MGKEALTTAHPPRTFPPPLPPPTRRIRQRQSRHPKLPSRRWRNCASSAHLNARDSARSSGRADRRQSCHDNTHRWLDWSSGRASSHQHAPLRAGKSARRFSTMSTAGCCTAHLLFPNEASPRSFEYALGRRAGRLANFLLTTLRANECAIKRASPMGSVGGTKKIGSNRLGTRLSRRPALPTGRRHGRTKIMERPRSRYHINRAFPDGLLATTRQPSLAPSRLVEARGH